ncbi:hypothetical protein UlMin_032426 [Ulmus minor]
MASIAAPPTPHNLTFPNPSFLSPKRPSYSSSSSSSPSHYHSLSRVPDSAICRCHNSSSSSPSPSDSGPWNWRWDSVIGDVLKSAIERVDSYVNSRLKGDDAAGVAESDYRDEPDWDWDRWRRHFGEVDEQERLLSVLKSQLGRAVYTEDFEEAARLKVAIAATATNDVVGRVMSKLNNSIEEERYWDAAFIRDNAGAGLVGWWTGISKDVNDTHGLIIRITAEHGRYVARSYSPRQLATAAAGVPLFEIFLTVNKKGEYKQQAVYLKRGGVLQDASFPSKLSDSTSTLKPLDSNADKSDLLFAVNEDDGDEDDDDVSDPAQGFSGFQNILRDMIPGVKVRVLKVTAPAKVDKDLISKVIEQIIEEDDDEDNDTEMENLEAEDEVLGESDLEKDVIELDADPGIVESEERGEIAFKVVVSSLMQKMSSGMRTRDMLRVPAKLKTNGRSSFSFCIEKDVNQQDSREKERTVLDSNSKLKGRNRIEHVMFDLSKFIGKEKIPLKVLKDVGDLISLTLSQAQNHQPLTGTTTFNRIELPVSSDPLNGLYIGAHGFYSSEVIHLRRKFGQWKEDTGTKTKESSNLEFYEYVEALKITGDPYVPAGQVAFRAKIGKRYQLPHKGIIPEEFGVVARYKGQGRLAAPGFRNPRWVDGELVILDGKYIKGGPVVGFVYWAPEYHFLVFFNRLRLQE